MDSNRLYEQIHHYHHQQQQVRRLNRINSNSNRCRSSLGAVASAKKMLHKSHPMTKVIMFALVFLVLCCLSTQSTGQELQQEQQQQQQPTTTTLPTTSSSSTTAATTTERLHHINANNDSNINNNKSFSQKNSSQVNNSSGTSTTLSSIQSLIAAPTQQRQLTATAASVSTPSPVGSGRVAHQRAPGSSSKTKSSSSNAGLKQQQVGNRSSPVANDGQRELIEQQSTSRSLSFAEPLMAASSSPAEQSTAATATHKSSVSNRWTHFGARLRPLSTASSAHLSPLDDHQRADSKSNIAYVRSGSSSSGIQAPQSAQVIARAPVSSNSVDADDQDDLDDDQDSEALLYKMMQQQGFLTGSLWAQQPQQVPQATGGQRAFGASGTTNQQQQYHNLSSAINSNANNNDADETGTQNSKKVIKLLKSYSHIHQVDDSDDQIRGTHTRLNVRQPAGSNSGGSYGNGWQPSGGAQYYNKNRSNEQRQQSTAAARLQPNHIYVSSQPLEQAYSNANARQQQLDARGSSGAYQPMNENNGADQQDYSGNGGEGNQQGSAGGAPEEDDFECPNNGIFADEASGCQSYHVCQSGAQVQQKFQCPMGTLFNNIILTCDFAHNVQCKGKETSPALRPAGLEESNEPIYRQQPSAALQQVPRASTQVNQGSYVPVNQQQAVSRQQQQQQQTRWSPQQPPQSHLQHQPAGPRHLKIGQSQYNQHQQPQQSNMNQAVNAYPHPQPPSNDLSDNNNNDDSDDEPVEPLIPATLPPQSTTLPYNSPPSSSVATPTQHQSAHRSQYPATSNVNQQQNNYLAHSNYRPQVNNGYDGDSAASPVFVSRDEPRTTEASVNLVTGLYKQQQQQQQQQQQHQPQSAQVSVSPAQDAQSFNLVINHLAPTRQQQPAKSGITLSSTNFKQQPATTDYLQSSNSKKAAGRQQSSSQLLPPQLPPKRVTEAKPLQQQQQQQYQQPFIPVVPTTNRQQSATSLGSQSNALSSPVSLPRQQRPVEPQYSQSAAQYDNQRQHYQQATQPKAVHVSQPSQPSTTSLPRLQVVDLTNDKRAGVSSEALNDGLLLIVRHSNSQNHHHHQQQQYQDQSAAYKQQHAARVAFASTGKPRSSSGGQAFALDPSAVQPNSPIDAQLFPNVQRVLAASQPAVSHQAAQTSQYVQHVPAQTPSQPQSQQAAAAAGSGATRVSPPLAPMEPPKPVISYNSPNVNKNSNHNSNLENQQPQYSSERTITHSDALQLIASSQSKKVSQQSEKKAPVKRSKRLKVQQVPLPSKPSTTTTTANHSAAQAKDPKPASSSHLVANSHKQPNQLRNAELPLQRINAAVNANQNTIVSNNKRHV